MLRMSGAISKSTEVMHAMQQLIRLPEIRDSMMELSKEMSKVCGATSVEGHLHCLSQRLQKRCSVYKVCSNEKSTSGHKQRTKNFGGDGKFKLLPIFQRASLCYRRVHV